MKRKIANSLHDQNQTSKNGERKKMRTRKIGNMLWLNDNDDDEKKKKKIEPNKNTQRESGKVHETKRESMPFQSYVLRTTA